MQKKLAIVGNSLALVIDKPLRRMLGLGPDVMVSLTVEGRRLIVEPIPASTDKATVAAGATAAHGNARADALRVFLALVNKHRMTQDLFRQLHPAGLRMGAYHGCLIAGSTLGDPATELVAMQRLQECLRALSAGASWDGAIAAVLATVPMAA